ncbi:hypothetical protein DL93DRAFT_1684574 [Clavulina sp. PMI_390]|nr:hypothetical protein DL93DRAFT_1684574 [Clavulina sp. PMI_390]
MSHNNWSSDYFPYLELRKHLHNHQQAHAVLRISDSSHGPILRLLKEEGDHYSFASFRSSILELSEPEILRVVTAVQNVRLLPFDPFAKANAHSAPRNPRLVI